MAFDLDLGITVIEETLELDVENNDAIDVDMAEEESPELEMEEVQQVASGTGDHSQLENRDAPNQHPISAISGLQEALDNLGSGSGSGGTSFKVGHGLKMEAENTLCVDTVSDFDGDNTLPITAAAVQETVGNIEILLSTI